jgi:hypothetical protein
VLEACRRLKTTDVAKIAGAMGLRPGVTAMTIKRLQSGGHLKGNNGAAHPRIG